MGGEAAVGGRRGSWFPLALLGFGLLALLGWDSVRTVQDVGWFAYAPLSSDDTHFVETDVVGLASYHYPPPHRPPLFPSREWPWGVLVVTALVATVLFYGRRARWPVRRSVTSAAGTGAAAVVCYVVVGLAEAVPDPAGLATSLGLPLAGLGVLAGAWAHVRRGRGRRVAAVLSVGCLVLGAAVVLGVAPGLLDPLIIAGGLLAVARVERARLPAVVAAAVLAAMVVFPTGAMSTLVPGAIMLAAAVVVLARQAGTGAPEPAT